MVQESIGQLRKRLTKKKSERKAVEIFQLIQALNIRQLKLKVILKGKVNQTLMLIYPLEGML